MNFPTICTNASWNPNATTFTNSTIIGSNPYAIFINRNDTLVTAISGRLVIFDIHTNNYTIIPANLSSPRSLFVTDDDQILVDNGACPHSRIERWSMKNRTLLSSISVDQQCWDLFVDRHDDVYCSQSSYHQVVKYSWRDPSTSSPTVVAGMKCPGSTSTMLSSPRGIFVTANDDLYVADPGNNRIQLFRSGERNGTTVAGRGASGTISLSLPTDVIVDGAGYLFIVDQNNHRIIGSDVNGFRCIAGCNGTAGSAANQLFWPWAVSFDSGGNLFVVDLGNNRIQRFGLLTNNLCSKCMTRLDRSRLSDRDRNSALRSC